jgi:hypothetical protein
MTRRLRTALIRAGCTVVGLSILGLVPGLASLANAFLEPGFALATGYWGGVHDPLQLAATTFVNWIFYSLVFIALSYLLEGVQ